jgi:hypothetical protein
LNRTGIVSRTFTGRLGNFSGGFPGLFNGTRGGAASTGSATIAITLNFKDSFSRNQLQAFTVPATVKTASQLSGGQTSNLQSGSSDSAELTYIAYAVVAAVAATFVVGAFMLRRYRAKRFASLPPESRGEQSVI